MGINNKGVDMTKRPVLAILCVTMLSLWHAEKPAAAEDQADEPDQYSNLVALKGYSFPVFASPGTETRAQEIAARCDRAYHFFQDALHRKAEVVVLVLSADNWDQYATFPLFGMPHCVDVRTLVIAGQENEMSKAIVPPLENLQPDVAQDFRGSYGQPDSSVSVGAFMDLLAIHEMMHLFIDQTTGTADFHLPRRWLVELLCNLGLHAYVVNEEPNEIGHLTIYPQTVSGLGYGHLAHTSLADFESVYAGMEMPNFAWYQCQLHVAAHQVYDAAGIKGLQAMFDTVVGFSDNVSDEELAVLLEKEVHPGAARVLTTWPDLRPSEK